MGMGRWLGEGDVHNIGIGAVDELVLLELSAADLGGGEGAVLGHVAVGDALGLGGLHVVVVLVVVVLGEEVVEVDVDGLAGQGLNAAGAHMLQAAGLGLGLGDVTA